MHRVTRRHLLDKAARGDIKGLPHGLRRKLRKWGEGENPDSQYWRGVVQEILDELHGKYLIVEEVAGLASEMARGDDSTGEMKAVNGGSTEMDGFSGPSGS